MAKDRREYKREWQRNNPDKVREARQKYRQTHAEKVRNANRAYRAKNTEKVRSQKAATHLRNRYGLKLADYDSFFEAQGGLCAICESPPPHQQRLCIDHNHDTGVICGLLCHSCNRAIGLFGDNPERLRAAIAYLASRLDDNMDNNFI